MVSMVVAVLSLVVALAPLAAGRPPAPGARPPARPGTSRPAGGPGGAGMQDTLLARVGGRRTISIAYFRHAWDLITPPTRPDSLTPESARGFLDLLIGKEVLGEHALRERWHWTLRDSAQVLGLADRLVMKAMLDSALEATRAERAAAGDTVSSQRLLGTLARDSTVARMRPVFDPALIGRMAAAWEAIPRPSRDSSMMAQLRVLGTLPVVAPADTGRLLARARGDSLVVRELLEAWQRISPLERPRVSDASQMEDLVRNVLFERLLRREAARQGIERSGDIASAVDRQREYVAVSHLVAREVYERLTPDSLDLARYFREHEREFELPMRLRVLRLVLANRKDGTDLALRLRRYAEAESIEALSRRLGLGYVMDVAAATDSVLFARAMKAGPGAVLGPDSTLSGWQVVRIEEVLPPRVRRLEEVRAQIETGWYNDEGERRMAELIARLRRQSRVEINERALARLTSR